jgi:hypothetical protein
VGLASITKQQGLFFLPLAWGLGKNLKNLPESSKLSGRFQTRPFLAAFGAVFALAVIWDVARARQPGFLAQSWVSYGGLSLSLAAIWERLLGFVDLLQYGTGSMGLNITLLVGLPLLMAEGVVRLRQAGRTGGPVARRRAQTDLVLLVFILLFLVGHSLVAFAVWDRYLLGLIPLLALLLARVLTLPWRVFKDVPLLNALSLVFVLSMLTFTLRPTRDAAASRFPVGGDHGAYQGIDQVAAYLKLVPDETTLYHRWLGWHWRFYLWGSPYDFRYWTSPEDLAAQASARPGARRYIVFPSWHSSTEARLALQDAGLTMREVHRAFRDDGGVSFILYRIEESP